MDSLQIIVEIVHSAYMQNYLILFVIFSLGCISASYLIGSLLGKIPIINKIFTSSLLTNLIIFVPLIFIVKSIIHKSNNYTLLYEKYLFSVVVSTILLLILVFNARRQIIDNQDFFKKHILSILMICAISVLYFQTTYSKNVESLSNKIIERIELLKKANVKGIEIAELVINYYIHASNQKIREFQAEQEKTITNYDKKFIEYEDRLKQSDAILKDLKNKSQTEQDKSLYKIEKRFDANDEHIKKSDKDLSNIKDKYQKELDAIHEEKEKQLLLSQQAKLKITELDQTIDKYKSLIPQNEQNNTNQTFQIEINALHVKIDQFKKQLNEIKMFYLDNNITQKISNLENDMNKTTSTIIILQDKLLSKESNYTNIAEQRDINNSQRTNTQ